MSTRLASDIATKLTIGLLRPITAQLDPYRIGVAHRGLEVAKVYGLRLANNKNLKLDPEEVVDHLVKEYPTHSFVIDRQEAAGLFQNVSEFSEAENGLFTKLRSRLVRPSNDDPFVVNFVSLVTDRASDYEEVVVHADAGKYDREAETGGGGESAQQAPRGEPDGGPASPSINGKPAAPELELRARTRLH